uniref:Uncharacterized protein n=1 Tax=Schistocephalus solidus TaxID=70667 RepID=A0A0X3PYA1_SCHSO
MATFKVNSSFPETVIYETIHEICFTYAEVQFCARNEARSFSFQRPQTNLSETSAKTAAVISENGSSTMSDSQSPPTQSESGKPSSQHSRRSRGIIDGTSFGDRAKVFDDL